MVCSTTNGSRADGTSRSSSWLMSDPVPVLRTSITGATPVIDVRNTGTGSDINQLELREVPSARDPLVVLQTIPGVLVSTVNVGGNQSGQQSYFVGKGIERHQTEWNLDGVNVCLLYT